MKKKKARILIELTEKDKSLSIEMYDNTTPDDLLKIVKCCICDKRFYQNSLPFLTKLATIVNLVECNTDREIETINFEEYE